jgi:FMN-dependent NADH-azoreductase
MKKILVVEASPNGAQSVSRSVTEKLIAKIKSKNPDVEIKTRDLDKNPVPHLNGTTVAAFFTPAESRTPELEKAIQLSDVLTDELLWADEIILSLPMWNFGFPSVVKAWVDHISRAGKTFSFTDKGLVGLAAGRKVHLIVSSGSVFSSGAFAAYDQVVPYTRTFFGFIGITDVSVVRAEGTNDPSARDAVMDKVTAQINSAF